jgi:Tfp pilus assembly protein PilO
MSNGRQKVRVKFLLIALAWLFGFGYAGYFLFTEIASSKNLYVEKSRELVSYEKKQEQIGKIKSELEMTGKNREGIISSLLSPKAVLEFILRIEDIAKKAGLTHEVRILKEITQESIDQELLAQRAARRRDRPAEEQALEEKLPGVTFNIDISGSYSGVIRFLEGIGTLSYYAHIESFSISGAPKGEGEESGAVKATIQLVVFTK